MKKFLFVIVSVIISAQAHALTLKAEVDRRTIAANESIRLQVNADQITNDAIDFSQLSSEFTILNTQRNSQQNIINGKRTANTQWSLILSPKKTGRLVIPSFKLKGAFSSAITITVKPAAKVNAQNLQNAEVFLDASVNKNQVYVQEQILLTYKLYYRISLASYNADELSFDNATVEKLSENTYQTNVRGQGFNVLEIKYAIHPQTSGSMTIPAQKWRLEKPMRVFGFGNSGGNPYVHVQSKAQSIKVKPIPTNSTAQYWLPSTAVNLAADWQNSLIKAQVGEPLTLQLNITANGLSASQLPALQLANTADFTIYPDQPTTDNQNSSSGIIGTRSNQFAVIPKKSGVFSFPEVNLSWWNVNTNKEETIRLPAQQIVVKKSSLSAESQFLKSKPTTTTNETVVQAASDLWLWQLSSLAFGAISLILLFLLVLSRRKNTDPQSINTEKDTQELNLKKIFKEMDRAVAEDNWKALRELIIRWGRLICQQEHLNSLSVLTLRFPELSLPLQQLENKIYGNRVDDSWNPSDLLQKLKKTKLNLTTIRHQKDKLQALYNSPVN